MTYPHATHFPRQHKIIQMNRFPRFFGRPVLPLGKGGNSYIGESQRTLQMMSI